MYQVRAGLQDRDSPSVNTAPAVDIRSLVKRHGTMHAVSSGLGVRHASTPLVAEPSLFGKIANRQAHGARRKSATGLAVYGRAHHAKHSQCLLSCTAGAFVAHKCGRAHPGHCGGRGGIPGSGVARAIVQGGPFAPCSRMPRRGTVAQLASGSPAGRTCCPSCPATPRGGGLARSGAEGPAAEMIRGAGDSSPWHTRAVLGRDADSRNRRTEPKFQQAIRRALCACLRSWGSPGTSSAGG